MNSSIEEPKKEEQNKITTALFTNFTDKEFIGWWGGKSRKYAPGQSEFMPFALAKHFAGHLVNQELLSRDVGGSLKYKDGEKMVSPKEPDQFPIYKALFAKAYQSDETEDIGDKTDDVDTLIKVAQKNRAEKTQLKEQAAAPQDPNQAQVILPPDFNEEEEKFAGTPDESKV